MKRLAVVFACMLLLVLSHATQAHASSASDSPWTDPLLRTRVEPALLKQLLVADSAQRLPMIVVMREQSASSLDRSALVPALQATAARSQAGVRGLLAAEQAAGRVEAVHPFWIFNGLALRGSPQTAEALARRDDVELIRLDHFEKRLSAIDEHAGATATNGVAWGVQRIRADLVWNDLRDTGGGVVVANMDTGVDFLHPALNANYRGNVGKGLYQHTGNWLDATGAGATYPVDGHGHGTHTMGTIAGEDGIGVAPGARWIAVRILNNLGEGYDSWIHAGFEWLLAPAGDPKLAPQVVNNSWGSAIATSTEFAPDLIRLRQAGIVVIFSAGNSGPGAGTIEAPAALPASFAVGATDTDDEVASFSSRGPSPWQEIKPQIAAPGVNVSSSFPGGAYAALSGTSMAAPHVSGVAALVLAANPSLTVTATEHILTSTAVSLGPVLPNNDTGWGRVDAYAAVQAAASSGIVDGTVVDGGSHLPLAGVQVTIVAASGANGVFALTTDVAGHYRAGLAAGAYRVTTARFGYQNNSAEPVTVATGATTTQDFVLVPLATGVLRGTLTDFPVSHPVSATISVLDTPVSLVAYGQYQLDLPAGTYTVQARALGYRVVTGTVTIAAQQLAGYNFALPPAPRILLVNAGAWYYDEYPGYFQQALDDLSYAYDERRVKHPASDTPTYNDLNNYDLVIWSAPQDSPGLLGASSAITRYLTSRKRLILTGQDVAFWDGGGAGLPVLYLRNYLKTNFVGDNSQSMSVNGVADDIMTGLHLGISGGSGANDQSAPDVVSASDDDAAAAVLQYGTGGDAGIRAGLCLPYRSLFLGFGFEGINTAAARRTVMQRAIDYLFGPPASQGFSLAATTAPAQVGPPGGVVTFTVRVRNTGEEGSRASYQAGLQGGAWPAGISSSEFTLAPCASTAMTVTARIPAGVAVDARDVLTLTVAPAGQPAAMQVITFTAKAPAPVLLVDHSRWYDLSDNYVQAFKRAGVTFDLWTLPSSGSAGGEDGPTAGQMGWYPVVVWYTGYDWLRPLSLGDEARLGHYLDAGGRLMFSSAFYLSQRADSTFARDRLGVLSYSTGVTSTLAYGSPGHPLGLGFGPTGLVDPFPTAGFFTLDASIAPSAAAQTVWRGDANRGLAIARDQAGNRLVFWAIPFEALAGDVRGSILQRTLGWLGALGRSTVETGPALAAPGQPVTVTIAVVNDLAPTPVAVLVTLPPGTRPVAGTLPSGLAYDAGANTLRYHDQVDTGTPRVLSFQLDTSQAAAGRLTGSVILRDERLGIDYEQPLTVGVAVPDLHSSVLVAGPARGGRAATVKMELRNDGPVPAPAATAVSVVPLRSQIVMPSQPLSGPGLVRVGPDGVTWQGALRAGETATVIYQVIPPVLQQSTTLPVEMLAWDGLGGAWEWRSWLAVQPYFWIFPLMGR